MKIAIAALVLAASFVAHADPVIDCPPDYQGGKMKTAVSVLRTAQGEMTAEVETSEGLMEFVLPADAEKLQRLLDEAAKRCGFAD